MAAKQNRRPATRGAKAPATGPRSAPAKTRAKPASGKPKPAPASSGSKPGRIPVENVNVPGYITYVDADMYQVMRTALLKVLPQQPPGLTQSEMFRAVVAHLPESHFPGGAKAGWWAKTVQLDLEAKRIVARQSTKPLRWHLAP